MIGMLKNTFEKNEVLNNLNYLKVIFYYFHLHKCDHSAALARCNKGDKTLSELGEIFLNILFSKKITFN